MTDKAQQHLGQLIEQIPSRLEQFNDLEFSHKPDNGKWSKKEILGHLVDSALNNMQRFIRVQYQDTPHIIYHQDDWVSLQHYQSLDRGRLVELWRQLNLQILHIWKNIPVDHLKRTCDTSKDENDIHDLEFLINDYVQHIEHHLRQFFPESEE